MRLWRWRAGLPAWSRRAARSRTPQGGCITSRDQLADAETALKEAADLAPREPGIRYHLGMVQYKKGQRTEATASPRKALELAKFPEEAAARKLVRELGG